MRGVSVEGTAHLLEIQKAKSRKFHFPPLKFAELVYLIKQFSCKE